MHTGLLNGNFPLDCHLRKLGIAHLMSVDSVNDDSIINENPQDDRDSRSSLTQMTASEVCSASAGRHGYCNLSAASVVLDTRWQDGRAARI